jgi:hypothetical protein
MKIRITRLSALLLALLLAAPLSVYAAPDQGKEKKNKKPARGTISIFNGKDLSGWAFFLKDPNVDPASVFSVKDGVIHISGNPFGYMRTTKTYSDYALHVEWRWPSEATNSGVFVHGQEPDAIWLKCIECQLMAGSAGDFVCMSGADMDERTDKTSVIVRKKAPSSEKAVGEWNSMDVVCSGNTIQVTVNGVLQNKGTNVSLNQGSICLQSEGKDIEFRNLAVTPLKKKTH